MDLKTSLKVAVPVVLPAVTVYEQGLLAMSERVTEVNSGETSIAPSQVPLEEKLGASRVTELPVAMVRPDGIVTETLVAPPVVKVIVPVAVSVSYTHLTLPTNREV